METLITIKSIDIDELKINKLNPATIRKTQVSKDVVEKFSKFSGTRKASIDTSALKKVKPEINTDDFSEYKEDLSLEQIFKKLGKSNDILVSKYGYTNLEVAPEVLEKAVNDSLEEPMKIIEEQQEEINLLKEENKKLQNKTSDNFEIPINPDEDIYEFPLDELEDI